MGTDSLRRFASIDIGSNAVRLLLCNVVEENETVHFNKSELVRIPIRLGEDSFRLGRISETKAEKFIQTMHAFKLLIGVFDPVAFRACATASLREASNGRELVQQVKSICGLKIDIISGKEEAELIYSNHIEQHLERDQDYLYVDVGGGSTEITLFHRGECVATRSFNVGTIRWLHGSIPEEEWEGMKSWVKKKTDGYSIKAAIGSGGNINKIHKLIGRKGRPLPVEFLKVFHDELKELSVDDRIDIWELNPDRADVIVPAARIYLSVMKAARVPEIIVPQIGLSDGIVHGLYEKHKMNHDSTLR
ncbi:MAG: Ppx/GppA phosphatase family protein [Bacteroidota bacterium]